MTRLNRLAYVASGLLSLGLLLPAGCSEEVEHKETDKPHMLDNGRTHEETTTYRNSDGTYTTEQSKTKTSD